MLTEFMKKNICSNYKTKYKRKKKVYIREKVRSK